MIQPYHHHEPTFGKDIRIHDMATVIGQVTLGDDVSIWPGAVLRGDMAAIRVGNRTNIQDGVVFHTDTDFPAVIGEDCVVGHQACVHACAIGNRCLIGINSTVLTGAVIGDECIIGAGAVVLEGAQIPARSLVLGVPGKVVRKITDKEVESILAGVREYLHLREQLPEIT
ncbi:MAG TPA: gamma carbonic anhydrase family protein [bacterium]|jgi:carbonic anhydrase/acetyltransferase-like protein (isoleucine patch superfamily)|nr:gamma carbonic anhydrase family protein [bacterium]